MSRIPVPRIIRSFRSTISLQIDAKGNIVVKAPVLVPDSVIHRFLESKEEWIRENLAKVQRRVVKNKQYVAGEEFYFLGIPYALHIGDYKEITVTTTFNLPKFLLFRVKKEITNWYIRQATDIVTKRVMYYAEKMDVEYKSIMFSDTKSKWGTCGPDNSLQFNWRLVMAPFIVLDYVVIHELAHTKEKNHGEKFWDIVRRYSPGYKQHRKWLRSYNHLLSS